MGWTRPKTKQNNTAIHTTNPVKNKNNLKNKTKRIQINRVDHSSKLAFFSFNFGINIGLSWDFLDTNLVLIKTQSGYGFKELDYL